MFDESLAARVRLVLAGKRKIVEKRLFGGTGFLLSGNLVVAIWKELLIARVGLKAYPEALREPFVQEFNVTGKSMRGWVMVQPPGLEDDDQLQSWIQRAMKFAATLDPK